MFQSGGSWLSSITSMVGNMFVSDEGTPRIEEMKARNSVLMALYEAVHLNRHFIETLAHFQTEAAATASPNISIKNAAAANQQITSSASASTEDQQKASATSTPSHTHAVPSNLLVTFLEYCSIVMQDTKTESSLNTIKLSFLILMCITEDQYANALMHDANLAFRVKLHRAPMRHRYCY